MESFHCVTALEVNQVLDSLKKICQQDCNYHIAPKLIAYKDKVQRELYSLNFQT